ncbi:MAG: RcnB family protein [Terracidiphilus sp.]
MKQICNVLAASLLAATLCGGAAFADDHHDDHHDNHHDNHQYVRHQEWKKGYHMRQEDWSRGERVDYRTYHLHRPPSGYEWRLVDGNYVMAAVATGIVASVVIAASTR